MIDLVFSNKTTDKRWKVLFFRKILQQSSTSRYIKLSGDQSVSVNLVGEQRMRLLNKTYRSSDKATDVLSFPVLEKRVDKNLKNYDIVDVGDIFICLPIAKKDADRKNVPIKKHLAFLAVHGFLHLLGFDHDIPTRARKMFNIQNKILNHIKY